ncbi:ZYRO0B04620p [Zygosaccharomyces rouxii]|uniref:ZYRO0B04620p n=1 Tax=Zygosaccharomyces rouxii (strain ATCC 2623 / CBS 732 / NBRC 1130 / NCYC 568 / NRRL Y-229) TaxID=559307 RepID=C5DR08_ZYGRC|nr:uncharacterized protein ZYRO0B04620g [Zygosaccharomyces rouxii]CAR26219.1 ZYRO0B04620p [Zygosaccharomyces rouxii]
MKALQILCSAHPFPPSSSSTLFSQVCQQSIRNCRSAPSPSAFLIYITIYFCPVLPGSRP